jgi:P4 family phage/plasmid primase-like protien
MIDYSIQILAYRKGLDRKSGKEYTYQKHFKEIRVTSILKLFENLNSIVELIPISERWDVHFTCANCYEPTEDKTVPLRLFYYQEMIPIDLDHIDLSKKDQYLKIVESVFKIDLSKTFISCSGHGLHLMVALSYRIESGEELHRLQRYYTALANQVSLEFFNQGLCGEMDSIRLSESATMRLPKTQNRKIPCLPVDTYVINNIIHPQPLYLDSLIDLAVEETLSKSIRNVDSQAVLSGCNFLKHCYDNPKEIKEFEWYAMIGILAFIPVVGIELCHTYSKPHSDYSFEDTQLKIEQALGFGKPRICKAINQIYPSCVSCPNFEKVVTPLSIKSDDFIATEHTGFHTIIVDKNGGEKSIPNYEDLLKFFSKKHTYVIKRTTAELAIFDGKCWKTEADLMAGIFATTYFRPIADNKKRAEFKGFLYSTNSVDGDFFQKNNHGYINFSNGVLRLEDRVLLEHSPDFGFTYVLPYSYNPSADCPEFDKMMDNISLKDDEMINLLLEYIGYAIGGLRASFGAKALLLTGGGSNGKSTFLNVIKMMVGNECFSSVSLKDMNDPNCRYSMVGKLFNICEEIEEDELRRGTAIFKSIVTGADVSVKKLYSDSISMRMDTKLIISCNELPSSRENTYAIYRRMLIVPFNAVFDKKSGIDKNIESRISLEMSGIYNKVLKAYDKFIKNEGNFTLATVSEKALEAYKYNNSTFNQFTDECLLRGEVTDYICSDDLMMAFNSWAQLNNIFYKPSHNKLIKELKIIGIVRGDSKTLRVGTVLKRVYYGIKKLNDGVF